MKKKSIFRYLPLFAAVFALTACNFEQDDLFDSSAAERLNEASVHYTKLFSEPKGGWAMEYYPNTGKTGAVLLMNFNIDGSVTTAMKNSASNNNYLTDTSCWQVITDLGPVLSFNTWNDVIHYYSNPENPSGKGKEGDYEFVITDAKDGADHFVVKGKKRGLYQRLTRLPDNVDYEAYLDDVNAFKSEKFPADCPNYVILEIGDSIYEVEDMEYTSPDIWPYGTDRVSFMNTYYYTITKQPSDGKYHLRFQDSIPITNPEKVRELVYNEEKDLFEDMANPAYTIRGPIPTEFFMRELGSGASFLINANVQKGESFATTYTTIRQAFAGLTPSYTLSNVTMRGTTDGKLSMNIAYSYKSGRTTVNGTARYVYTMERKDNTVTLKYDAPYDEGSGNIYNALPALQTFLKSMERTYSIEATESRFNLSKMIYTATDDKDFWFIPNYTQSN